MKKNIISLFIVAAFASCAAETVKSNNNPPKEPSSIVSELNASKPGYEKGMDLVAKYQCITCHKVDEKLTGPAYREVAAKYAGANDTKINELAKKIILGGSGVWGEIIMTPHPNVSEEDARTMVKYILLLKK